MAAELVVVEPQLLDAVAAAEALGDGAAQLVVGEVDEAKVGAVAERGWDGAGELIAVEAELDELHAAAEAVGDGATQPIVVQLEGAEGDALANLLGDLSGETCEVVAVRSAERVVKGLAVVRRRKVRGEIGGDRSELAHLPFEMVIKEHECLEMHAAEERGGDGAAELVVRDAELTQRDAISDGLRQRAAQHAVIQVQDAEPVHQVGAAEDGLEHDACAGGRRGGQRDVIDAQLSQRRWQRARECHSGRVVKGLTVAEREGEALPSRGVQPRVGHVHILRRLEQSSPHADHEGAMKLRVRLAVPVAVARRRAIEVLGRELRMCGDVARHVVEDVRGVTGLRRLGILWGRLGEKPSEAIRSHQKPSEAIRSHQKHSEALRSTQKHSDALRITQEHSGAIRSNQEQSEALKAPKAPRSNQEHSEAFRSNQKHSEAIRSTQKYSRHSEALRSNHPVGRPRREAAA